MTDYTLYGFLESGNSYKPALMLQMCGADWHCQWVDFFNGGHRAPEFLALNSMGEVPLLVDHTQNDLSISQSGVQLTHLAQRFDQFAPQNDDENREILRWILFDNHKLTGSLSVYRFLNKFLGKGDTPEAKFMQQRMIQAFKTLNRHMEDRDFIATDGRASIADISIIGYLTWPDHFNTDWDDYPNIKLWLERMQNLPNYAPPEDLLPTA